MEKIKKLGTGVYLNKETNNVFYVESELRTIMKIFELRDENLSFKKIAETLGIKTRYIVKGILENYIYKRYYEEVHKNWK